jgi:quercetin dioxygenase-like cupin family protein
MPGRAIVLKESEVPLERWSDPIRGDVGFRTLFGGGVGTTESLTVGVTEMQPGDWLGAHRHTQAEVYFILDGHGRLVVDGEEQSVEAGTAVFIPGDVEHGIRNDGDAVFRFFYAFAAASFSDIHYRFTGEVETSS